uniref:Uncharacterized protein n=2 Tax=Kalmanozyma brasiliensis (strain GHG001) TaxID=1365824 RepID=V5F0K8_KALBG
MTYRDAQTQLQARKARYVASAAELRQTVAPELRAAAPEDMMAGAAIGWTGGHTVSQENEALNEEGLPFYEPVEKITEEEATQNKKAYLQPFVRSDDKLATDKDERRQWLDKMLSKLEEEEKDEDSDEEAQGAQGSSLASSSTRSASEQSPSTDAAPSAEEETRVVLRARTPSPPPTPETETKALPEIVSATRPPPPKSALKPTARPIIEQRPSFGSAGIRHGFLNLNPSSPGAIKSSYSWEDLEREEKKNKPAQASESERPSRSHTPTPLSRESSTMASSLLGRVTGASSSPMTSGTSTPTKKSVRIKSPERAHPEAAAGSGLTPLQRALRSSIRVKENYDEPSASSQPAMDASSKMARALESGSGTAGKRHRDDIGVEEEAERIVQLLGPGVVEGHPNAPSSDVLKKMQEAHDEEQRFSTPEALAARAKQEEEEREKERLQRLAEKPALGHSVMERPKSSQDKGKAVSTQVKAQQAKFSAFKAGFLNQKPTPTKFVPNTNVSRKAGSGAGVPAAPTQSLGMSALDRASLGDDELSERRQAMGLPAAVPHARPSKAYAEKMKQRQEGGASQSQDQDDSTGTIADKTVKLARPTADDDVPRPGRVRFGPPAGAAEADHDDGDEQVPEIMPSTTLDNHLSDDIDNAQELDEEQEDPKILGEGADTDEEDAYYDSYLSKRSRRAAASDSRGLDVDDDDDDDDLDDDIEDEDDWGVDEDDFDEDEDDDFDYDPEDLMALAPKMREDVDALSAHPELLKEYEEARARLAAMGLAIPGDAAAGGSDQTRAAMIAAARAAGQSQADEEDEDDYEMDVVPLDEAVEDSEYQGNTSSTGAGPGSRISRFKASLAQRQMENTRRAAPSSGKNLEDMLSSAQNLGQSQPSAFEAKSAAFSMDGRSNDDVNTRGAPMMIIPSLAPVRFPKNGDLVEGKSTGPVDLDGGESDDDDEKAEMVMRSRLERLEWRKEHPEEAKRLSESKRAREMVEQGKAPPPVARREDKEEVGDEASQAEVKPKKVSRFKAARMGQ